MSAVRVRLYQHPTSESVDACAWPAERYRGELYLPLASVDSSPCSTVAAALEERLSRYAILHLPADTASKLGQHRLVQASPGEVASSSLLTTKNTVTSSDAVTVVPACNHDNRSDEDDVASVHNTGPQLCTHCSANGADVFATLRARSTTTRSRSHNDDDDGAVSRAAKSTLSAHVVVRSLYRLHTREQSFPTTPSRAAHSAGEHHSHPHRCTWHT